jgi:hypothetical protein
MLIKWKIISTPQARKTGILELLLKLQTIKTPAQRAREFIEMRGGKLQCLLSPDRSFKAPISSPEETFSTIVILDLLGDSPGIQECFKQQCLSYILGSFEDGIIPFFKDPLMRSALPPDVDCTAYGAAVLVKHGKLTNLQIQEIVKRILGNVNEAGIIQVYFEPRGSREGRLDPAVCANALCFLNIVGQGEAAKRSEDYVYQTLQNRSYLEGTRYYPSPDTFLFFVTRMVESSYRLRDRFEPLLKERIVERLGQTEYPLDCALRVIASRMMGVEAPQDITTLLSQQTDLGNFPADIFFKCGTDSWNFGSEALTTAFAIVALDPSPPKGPIPTDTLYYPFDTIKVEDGMLEPLKMALSAWCDNHHLFDKKSREKYVELITSYTTRCAPEDANLQSFQLANKFLAIYFVLNDHFSQHPDGDRKIFDTLHLALSGSYVADHAQEGSWKFLINAARDLRKELVVVSLDHHLSTDYFSESFGKFVFAAKNECEFFERDVSVDDFHQSRLENIFMNQYLELWGILIKELIPPNLRDDPIFLTQTRLASHIIYLANDIMSLERDTKTNKPNYILVLSRQKQIDIEIAKREALLLHRELVISFVENSKRGCYHESPSLSQKLNDFLKICMSGNFATMLLARDRYSQ